MVEVAAVTGEHGELTHTHTWAPVSRPKLLVTTDMRRLQLWREKAMYIYNATTCMRNWQSPHMWY